MAEELISELVEFIKTASPFVWNTFIKQIYVNGIGNILLGIGLWIASYLLYKPYRRARKHSDESNYYFDVDNYLYLVCSIIAFIIGIVMFTYTLKNFLNPEYYAIMKIIELIK